MNFSFIQKVKHLNWKRYLIEPALIFLLLPSYLTDTLSKNFELDKVCRLDLQLSPLLCATLSSHGLNCIELLKDYSNVTTVEFSWEPYKNVTDVSHDSYNFTVCKAKSESEKICAGYYAIGDSIGEYFSLFIV